MKFTGNCKSSAVSQRRVKAQTAIEYLALLGVVTVVVLTMFRQNIPVVVRDANEFYNQFLIILYGDRPNADPDFNAYP